MPDFCDTLNRNYGFLFEAAQNMSPVEYLYLEEGVFVGDENSEDLNFVNPPIAGHAKSWKYNNDSELTADGNKFILRTIMGYSAAARCIDEDAGIGMLIISNVINSCLNAAYKKLGMRIIQLTFLNRDNYINELENHAGYEIVLSGTLSPALAMETVTNGIV